MKWGFMKKNPSAKKICIDSVETSTGGKLPEIQLEHQVAILEATPDFVGYADARTRQILYINQAGRKMTGLTKDEDVTKLKISDVHPEWTNQMFDKEILPAAIREGVWNGECAFRSRDGREIPVMMVLIAHKSINGEVERFSTISRNITDHRREEALRESERKYRNIYEDAVFGIYQAMPEGRFISANDASARMAGYNSPEELIDTIKDIGSQLYVNPEERQKFIEIITANGIIKGFEVEFYKKDRSRFWMLINARAVKNEQGRIIYYEGIAADVTQRRQAEDAKRRLEERLQRAEKMESLGTLAGGIAHDFNNILASIIGYTELTLEGLEDELLRENLSQVLKGCGRAKDLARQILTFSRRTERDKRPVDLRMIVKEVLKLLRSSLPTTIEIRQALGDTPLHVMADPTEIHQVMMNLCTNASHAMLEKGGVLHVGICQRPIEEHLEYLFPDTEPVNYVKLTVSDTGHGIAPAIMDKIFDPFFTTKGSGEGTGLGLSVVYGIVKSHEGVVHVESEPGQGAAFSIYLPLIQEVSSPARAISAVNPTGTERIIFVDDEQAIVTYSKKVLASLGYQVTATTSSEEALELFRTHPDRFDLVIADMTMPKITGAVLSGALLEIRPDIPIILCSGFSDGMSEEKARAIGVRKFLMKPLNRRELAVVIREILDEGKEKATEGKIIKSP
jgi:PAS domain S-box-containing protein